MKVSRLIYASIFLMIFLSTFLIAQSNYKPANNSSAMLTGEDYITGEDGIPRMNINILGHIKYPGTYLVYDGIDVLTCLAMAGGPMTGAKLSKISIISKDGQSQDINLTKIMNANNVSSVVLKPYDSIYIEETLGNYLLARSNVINILLQITNLILISTNSK